MQKKANSAIPNTVLLRVAPKPSEKRGEEETKARTIKQQRQPRKKGSCKAPELRSYEPNKK